MLEKPLEWRRFERVELEGEVARAASRPPVVSSVPPTPSLLQEFERVLRENERLQMEVTALRGESGRNGSETAKFRNELRTARIELRQIEGEPSTPERDAGYPAHELVKSNDKHNTSPESREKDLLEVARLVAGYLFPEPTDLNVRLVKDAMRARGIEEFLR
jgi:hypothetical protein